MPRAKRAHRRAFLHLCREIAQETGVPLSVEEITSVLGGQCGWEFPEGRSQMCTATTHPVLLDASAHSGIQIVASLVGMPQIRDGYDDNTFALKVVDLRHLQESGLLPAPISPDLFPNGRQILEVAGLRLDTAGPSHFVRDTSIDVDLARYFDAIPGLRYFTIVLIRRFPALTSSALIHQAFALEQMNHTEDPTTTAMVH